MNIKTSTSLDIKDLKIFNHLETRDGRRVPIEHISIFDLRRFFNDYKEKMISHAYDQRTKMGLCTRGRPPPKK